MSNAIVVNGEPVYVGRPVVLWTESGLEFTVLRKRSETRFVVHHHTGGSGLAPQVHRTLTNRGLSVHFTVEPDGTIYQYCDANRECAHAKGANAASIGIEHVNPAVQRVAKGLPHRELLREEIHGSEHVYTSLTLEQVRSAINLTAALLKAYGLPWVVPMAGHDVLQTSMPRWQINVWRGIVGHYHVDPELRKWDPGLSLMRALAAVPLRGGCPLAETQQEST